MANVTKQPTPGTRCRVYDAPGVVLYTAADGMVAVRLAGESTWHFWSPSQVEVAL